ncbi:uncharacterized protein TRUGW13939_05641 [Talaromyces rugulosus]|uniref:N-acetyltransferase domain-containing protein n=1 Tax=Talaromyces rugulosus TaxID=121627 RepID=A0A7H8QX60_TALRU|nr:uncharacterized protein TRUGW13939_05641 [Talaromyces rugulosus]QKX58517.1 hypothetical protein TRUGW13939_05641 [Talaromyces rugulosus]
MHKAFLSSLRTNLQISYEDTNAASFAGALHPALDSFDLQKPPYLNDLAFASGFTEDLEDPPSPTSTSTSTISSAQSSAPATWTYHVSTNDDRSEALNLIADSVVEQRLVAIRSILLHPAVLGVALVAALFLTRSAYYEPRENRRTVGIISVLIVMVAWIALHYTTKSYLSWATTVADPAWLRDGLYQRSPPSNGSAGGSKQHHGHHSSMPSDDEVLITKHHGKVVGVLVLRTARTNALSSGAPSANGMRALRHRHTNSSSSGRLTGVIRAWAVDPSHRHHGFGSTLLESAVSICRLRRLDGPIFADEHLYSAHMPGLKMLPWPFNRAFEKSEERAKESLRVAIEGKERKK